MSTTLLIERFVTNKFFTKYIWMGNCLDNAVMENFFGIMKSELQPIFKPFPETPSTLKVIIDYKLGWG